jgi:uncharacterized membrane protein YfcA
LTAPEALAVLAAGATAGFVNTIVGSGSLVTFPVLLAVGYQSVTANVSNTVGLVFGGISGIIGYRRELGGQARRAATLGTGTTLGAIAGGTLLLALPSSVFDAVVPALILLAVALMTFRPKPAQAARNHTVAATASAFLTGIYGGYFGAAQGVILLAVLRLCFADDLQKLNALKNVLAGVANAVAALLFVFFAPHIAWGAAALIAVGSIGGAQLGAHVGRRLPEEVLRRIVIVVGTVVAIVLWVK